MFSTPFPARIIYMQDCSTICQLSCNTEDIGKLLHSCRANVTATIQVMNLVVRWICGLWSWGRFRKTQPCQPRPGFARNYPNSQKKNQNRTKRCKIGQKRLPAVQIAQKDALLCISGLKPGSLQSEALTGEPEPPRATANHNPNHPEPPRTTTRTTPNHNPNHPEPPPEPPRTTTRTTPNHREPQPEPPRTTANHNPNHPEPPRTTTRTTPSHLPLDLLYFDLPALKTTLGSARWAAGVLRLFCICTMCSRPLGAKVKLF